MSLINTYKLVFMLAPDTSFDKFHEIATKLVRKVEEYGGDAENILDLGYTRPVTPLNEYNLLRYGCVSFSGTSDITEKLNKECYYMDDIVTSMILEKDFYNDQIFKQEEVKHNA